MSARRVNVFEEADIVEVLRSPELLAVADAIAVTQRPCRSGVWKWQILVAVAASALALLAAPASALVQIVSELFSGPAPSGTAPHVRMVGGPAAVRFRLEAR
jgi:hypothetical protein